MFDAMKLLEQLLGPQAAAGVQSTLDQGTKTVEGFVGADTIAKGKAMLGEGLGSLEATASQYMGADKVAQAKDLFAKQGDGLAMGALAGGLLGLLVGTDTGRKVGGSALKIGSLAALGGLAWKAYQSYQGGTTEPVVASPSAAPEDQSVPTEAQQKLAASTIISMIQAAKADGRVDAAERAAILARVGEVEAAAKAFLETELAAPLDLDRVASLATTKEEAVHLYAASLLAIDPDEASEKAYLEALAQRLDLDPALVAEITAQVKAA